MPLAFINYRRRDAQPAALALEAQLTNRLGRSSVFLDVSHVRGGMQWPDRIRDALVAADVLLAVIGPDWLRAADRHGRRRLDEPDDWVRLELVEAMRTETPIVPLLVNGGELPEAEGLPEALVPLLRSQAMQLRDESWSDDLDRLIRLLIEDHGFHDNQPDVALPPRVVTIDPLDSASLETALADLPGWEPVESALPRDYPNTRHELRKVYVFPTFADAVAFMGASIEAIEHLEHHPRWENQWTSVTVHLSTWDIGHRISTLDVDLAHLLDRAYRAMQQPAT